jgi:acyl-CoA synthetase (AMP-forming)/AMP-acid ligase II
MTYVARLQDSVAQLTGADQHFEIVEKHIHGISHKVYKNTHASMREYLELALSHADKPFLVTETERYSYAEAYQMSIQFAAALVNDYGIVRGDRVAIAMRNNPQWIMAFMGAVSIGAVVVPMNAWWTSDELRYGLRDSGARLVVVDSERAQRVEPFIAELGVATVLVSEACDAGSGFRLFTDLLEDHSEAGMPDATLDVDDDIIIMYTSGSTGKPKGVVSSHRAILSGIMSWLLMGYATQITPQDDDLPEQEGSGGSGQDQKTRPQSYPATVLLTLPLFHVTASHNLFLLSVMIGRKVVMMHKWDVEVAMSLIERERVTTFSGVPTMSAELQHAAANGSSYDLSSLTDVLSGGAARPAEQVKKISDTFRQAKPGSGYGLTETNGVGTANTGAMYQARPASCGRAVPAVTDIKIVDPAGDTLPVGERGEICVKSPANARGYWNLAEATAESFINGWFLTGDVGYLDDEGFLFIVDRIKEIIIRGGENISPLEVEAAIYEHSAVEEVAVFGLPDDRLGEIVGAAVVLHPGEILDQNSLVAFLAEHLAKFKIPVHLWFHEDRLPRLATGKVFKRRLKDEYSKLLADNSGQDRSEP